MWTCVLSTRTGTQVTLLAVKQAVPKYSTAIDLHNRTTQATLLIFSTILLVSLTWITMSYMCVYFRPEAILTKP